MFDELRTHIYCCFKFMGVTFLHSSCTIWQLASRRRLKAHTQADTDFPSLTNSFFLMLQLRHSSSVSVSSVAAQVWDTGEVETREIDRELN